MSFIDDGIEKREVAKDRRLQIATHGPKIYGHLWDRINAFVGEAKQKGFSLFTNGSVYERVVEIQFTLPGESASQRDKLTITLDAAKEHIRAHGTRERKAINLTFDLDVCPDGIVCLKHDGQQVDSEAAAVLILKGFLFPEQ